MSVLLGVKSAAVPDRGAERVQVGRGEAGARALSPGSELRQATLEQGGDGLGDLWCPAWAPVRQVRSQMPSAPGRLAEADHELVADQVALGGREGQGGTAMAEDLLFCEVLRSYRYPQ